MISFFESFTKNNKYKLVDYQKRMFPKNEIYKDMAKTFDRHTELTKEQGEELESICDFENYFIGIHRTGFVQEENIRTVFQNGLINNGHRMQGAPTSSIFLTDTVTPCSNFIFLMHQIIAAPNYEDGVQGVFIVKVPKEYLAGTKPIYFNGNGTPYLLPEYIYGCVTLDGYGIKDIIKNPKYTDNHNYADDGLLYETPFLDKVSTR